MSKLACFALRGFGLVRHRWSLLRDACASCPMVVDEAARFAEWTKEGRGEMPPPEEPLAKELCELFKAGDIVVSSIVTNATVIPKADLRELWSAVWTDVDVIRQAAGDKAMSSSRRQRYVLWALLPSALYDVTRDEVPSRSADKKRAPEAVSRHRFRADDSDDEVEEISPISSRQRKDMEDQGALNPSDLPCMYLSVHVGRRAGRSEHGGMTYGSHWSLAKGLKHVAKNPSSLGSKNLPQLLERAKDTGDLTELDKFVQKTSDSFMTDTTDPFWVTGGSRLLRRWTRGKTVCRTSRAAAWYFFLFWEEHPGRGIPDISDHDIIREAETAAEKADAMQCRISPQTSYAASAASGVSGYGSLASSASQQETTRGVKLEEMMVALLAKVTETQTEVTGLRAKQAEFARQVRDARTSEKEEDGKGPQCYYCRMKGHFAEECPRLAEKEARKAGKAADAPAAGT